MKTKELLEAGQLTAAIDHVTQEVKANPTQVSARISLFELLSVAGEWDRAEKQLDVISHQDSVIQLGVQVYRNNIKAERSRQQLFAGGVAPHFLNEPPAYVDQLLSAINCIRSNNLVEARTLLDQAEEARPALPGILNGKPFQDFRDCSDLTGSILELVIHDKYTWVPWEEIKSLEIAPPKQLRDLIWASARIESQTGAMGEVYLHALYPGTFKHENNQVRLGRMTDYTALCDELFLPAGLRLFLVDDEEKSLFESKSIQFAPQTTKAN